MRLLPHSRRGKSLLAGAAWCAACAGWWWVLPVVPRAVMTLPENCRLLGFGPDGETALIRRAVAHFESDRRGKDTPGPVATFLRHAFPVPDSTHRLEYALDLVAVPSAQRLVTFLVDDYKCLDSGQKSADGRSWLFHCDDDLWRVVNVVEQSVTPLAITDSDADRFKSFGLSPDGRYALFRDDRNGFAVILWDVVHNRLHGRLAQYTLPGRVDEQYVTASFSLDSRSLAVLVKDRKDCIQVIEIDSLARISAIPNPVLEEKLALGIMALNPNGDYLAADYQSTKAKPEAKLFCWNLKTGQVVREPIFAVGPTFTRDGLLFAQSITPRLIFYDPKSWTVRFAINFERGTALSTSDDDTIVTAQKMTSETGLIENLAKHLGIKALSAPAPRENVQLIRSANGELVGEINSQFDPSGDRFYSPRSAAKWIPNRPLVAFHSDPYAPQIRIYDIPPRKPFLWFAAGAAILALPIAFVAWRRVRKLRAA
jgi:hypothetical protein